MERFIHAFNMLAGANYELQQRIINYFKDWRYAWEKASHEEFLRAGVSGNYCLQIIELRKKIDIEEEFSRLYAADIAMISRKSAEYPPLLKLLRNAPFALYRKGAALDGRKRHIAVVGTRKMTAYGEKYAYRIGEGIALNGAVVVSGLAFGIDARAHYAAVKCGKPTVAVLAGGVGNVTPACNMRLAESILANGGTLISEYAQYGDSFKYRYLERNRIIAGMCEATVVVEAPEKSGALITARAAAEYDREVFVLAGDIDRPQSAGCIELIEKGQAFAAFSVDGLLGFLKMSPVKDMVVSCDKTMGKVIQLLAARPLAADEIASRLKINVQELNVLLTKMEMAGIIQRDPMMKWRVTPISP